MPGLLPLIRKDVTLNWRPAVAMWALYFGAFLVIKTVVPWLVPQTELGAKLSVMFLPVVLNANLLAAAWLIEHERGSGTFALLRTLPVSDRTVVTGKVLVGAAIQAVGGLLCIGLLLPELLRPDRLPFAITLLGGLITFGTLSMAARLRLGTRMGAVAPLLVLLVPFLLLIVLTEAWPAGEAALIHALLSARFSAIWWAVEVLVNLALWDWMARWLGSRDTRELVGA